MTATNPAVTVYSKPVCVQCEATYKALDRRNVPYTVIDITTDDTALERLRALGHMSAPVVEVTWPDSTTEAWAGFRPDSITALAQATTEALAA